MPARTRCTKCVHHGDSSFQDRYHKRTCPYLACACRKCILLNERKVITDKLLKRPAPVKVRAERSISRYTCSKCRRHGLIVSKKFHEPCPYILCECEICKITIRKKQIDRELEHICRAERKDLSNRGNTRLLRSLLSAPTEPAPTIINEISQVTQVNTNPHVYPLNSDEENSQNITLDTPKEVIDPQVLPMNSGIVIPATCIPLSPEAESVVDQHAHPVNSVSPIVQAETLILPEAQIMIDLISALASSNDFSTIDYEAVRKFLTTPSFDVPSTWSSHFPAMIELVHIALRRLPYLHDIEFERIVG